MTDKINEKSGILLQGHIKIHEPDTGKVIIDKRNAIHYENMSISLAESIGNGGQGWIYEMGFGNGGTSVDPTRNKIETRHVSGTNYTDVFITCLLDYGEPTGQDAFDTATDTESLYVFDELGLKSYSPTGTGRLLTHVIFHPVQKSLNRLIQVDYTVRVQSLTGFNEG
jgi:hypothetical protein